MPQANPTISAPTNTITDVDNFVGTAPAEEAVKRARAAVVTGTVEELTHLTRMLHPTLQ
jgi:hypothetical protein